MSSPQSLTETRGKYPRAEAFGVGDVVKYLPLQTCDKPADEAKKTAALIAHGLIKNFVNCYIYKLFINKLYFLLHYSAFAPRFGVRLWELLFVPQQGRFGWYSVYQVWYCWPWNRYLRLEWARAVRGQSATDQRNNRQILWSSYLLLWWSTRRLQSVIFDSYLYKCRVCYIVLFFIHRYGFVRCLTRC